MRFFLLITLCSLVFTVYQSTVFIKKFSGMIPAAGATAGARIPNAALPQTRAAGPEISNESRAQMEELGIDPALFSYNLPAELPTINPVTAAIMKQLIPELKTMGTPVVETGGVLSSAPKLSIGEQLPSLPDTTIPLLRLSLKVRHLKEQLNTLVTSILPTYGWKTLAVLAVLSAILWFAKLTLLLSVFSKGVLGSGTFGIIATSVLTPLLHYGAGIALWQHPVLFWLPAGCIIIGGIGLYRTDMNTPLWRRLYPAIVFPLLSLAATYAVTFAR